MPPEETPAKPPPMPPFFATPERTEMVVGSNGLVFRRTVTELPVDPDTLMTRLRQQALQAGVMLQGVIPEALVGVFSIAPASGGLFANASRNYNVAQEVVVAGFIPHLVLNTAFVPRWAEDPGNSRWVPAFVPRWLGSEQDAEQNGAVERVFIWAPPGNMRLLVALSGGYGYLFLACKMWGQFALLRLPLGNIFNTGRLCLGYSSETQQARFLPSPASAGTLLGRWSVMLGLLGNAKWNADLIGHNRDRVRLSEDIFRFSPEDGRQLPMRKEAFPALEKLSPPPNITTTVMALLDALPEAAKAGMTDIYEAPPPASSAAPSHAGEAPTPAALNDDDEPAI